MGLFGSKEEVEPVSLICPHCHKRIEESDEDTTVWVGNALLVGCPHCEMVLGSHGEL